MARVVGLRRLGLCVPRLPIVGEFYIRTWGMRDAGQDGGERFFQSRAADHADVILRPADEAKLDHLGLTIGSEAELDELLAQIERAGHDAAERPRRGTRPGDALMAAVNDPDGNRIELVVPAPGWTVQPMTDGSVIGPQKLSHVVLWTPQAEKQEAFYSLLGFRVSDRTHVGMSFLRCNQDHHTVALVRSARGRTGLQHAAFDVGALDSVMREAARMRDSGHACIWGVGRHGPGNNVFSYYRDPAGNIIEYFGDMERVMDTAPADARYWGPEHKGDIWGWAGPPPEPFRD